MKKLGLKFYNSIFVALFPKKRIILIRKHITKTGVFFAELLAVAEKNAHPLFAHSYQILQEKGLPQKVFQSKRNELQKYNLLERENNRGIAHFSNIKIW